MTVADLIKWHEAEQARWARLSTEERSTLPTKYKANVRRQYARKAEFHSEAVRTLGNAEAARRINEESQQW